MDDTRAANPGAAGLAADPPMPPSDLPPLDGHLSPAARADLSHSVSAWTVLIGYLGASGEPQAPVARRLADTLADVLGDIQVSRAPEVLRTIFKEGQKWLSASGYTPDPQAWAEGATALVDAGCPPEHRAAARDCAQALARDGIGELVMAGPFVLIAMHHPVAGIHAAAACVAYLATQPAAVPDLAGVIDELLQRTVKFAELAG